jgi:mannose-6-phosphate isomerase
LGKAIGEGDDYAESWEIVDHGEDQSRVMFGPLAGQKLGDLVRESPRELLGADHAPAQRFPLLFKFLDAQRDLSVQVHPNDAQASLLEPPDLGKTEAWVILDATPGSRIYSGLKRGFDRNALEREINRGTCELCLNSFEPRPGDCIFIPAGTLHALGAGLLVAEIQQASDTTFRIYDWNRVGADGKSRPLHIQQALDVIDYNLGPVGPQLPQATDRPFAERLVSCDKFVLDRWQITEPQSTVDTGGFHILVVLSGAVQVEGDPSGQLVEAGQTILLPAAVGATRIVPRERAELLDIVAGQ